jgi:branched-subunit amino acid transport protein
MNILPAAKLKMMKASIRCLVFGLLAFVPVIGIPFGIAALWLSGLIRRDERQLWNPAKPYRLAGMACAMIGIIGWFLIAALIVAQAVSNS